MSTTPATLEDDALHAQLLALAREVTMRDVFPVPLRTLAALSMAFDAGSGTLHAAAVLVDATTLQPLAERVWQATAKASDAGGLSSFVQVPVAIELLAQLPQLPDVLLVDGHGSAHPARCGLASHLGMAADLATIGVAETALLGSARPLHEMRGAFSPLRDGREQVGWILRSKIGEAPLVVSPGHRMSMAAAPELVMRCVRDHRLPDVLLRARRLLPPTADSLHARNSAPSAE